MEKKNFKYKNSYTGIFSLNYFIQGVNTSMFVIVVPIYILIKFGRLDSAAIAFMLSIILIPAAIKLIYGIITDKVSIKKLGRRKPWIIFPATFAGLIWLILPFIMPSTLDATITLFTISGICISFGMFMSDTATDGFIMDICPKEQLGRAQGFCWALRAMGVIAGGPVLLLTLIFLPIEFLFIILGIMMIAFSLFTLLLPVIEEHKDLEIIPNLKLIFKRSENWKTFTFSLFTSITGGIVYAFVSLYILIQGGFINPEGATLASLEDVSLYAPQALVSLIISLGIFVGSIMGGIIADKKSRRVSALLSAGLTTCSLFFLLIPSPFIILLILAFFVGFASGWSFSSFTAIAAEYSQQYPDFNSTYYSICVSFANIGIILGLVFAGIVFNSATTITSDSRMIFGIIFISMAIMYDLMLIPLLLMDRKQYEYKLANQ